jgi:hypothetical protein
MMRARFPNAAFAIILSCSMAPSLRGQAQRQGQPLATEKHRRLAFLVGQWDEEVTRTDAKPGEEKSKGRWTARPVMGFYLTIQYGANGPRGAYRAFGVLTYDQQQERYRLWWFDDAAGIGEYSGDFTDSNSLVMEHKGNVEGKAFRERIHFIRVSQDEVDTTIEQAWEKGVFKPYTQAVAHRVVDAQAPPRPAEPPQR